MFETELIEIFRGDDTDGLGYQTIVGRVETDIDLTGCTTTFRYLDFTQTFTGLSSGDTFNIVMSSSVTKTFPPGLGFASIRVTDSDGKVRTFNNRIPVIVKTSTPCAGGGQFTVRFRKFPELAPLKIYRNGGTYDEYVGYVQRIIDKATATQYGLAMLYDGYNSEDGASTGKAASPAAVKAAYDAVIANLTDNYYTAQETEQAIDRLAAYYITSNASGDAFNTRAALVGATTYYSGGAVRVPTRNDYAVVLADETHSGAEWRYIYSGSQWEPQYPIETNDYEALSNKPSVNGKTLTGAVTLTGEDIKTGTGESDPTITDALDGKRGLSDLGVIGAPTGSGDYFVINGVRCNYAEKILPVGTYPGWGSGTPSIVLYNTSYIIIDENNNILSNGFQLSHNPTQVTDNYGTTYTITGYVDTLAKESQIPDVTGKANRAELCGAWAANTAYTTTSFVIHENAIYRCTEAHTSGEEWDSSKWTSATVADVLAQCLPLSGGELTGRLTIRENELLLSHTDNGVVHALYLTYYGDGQFKIMKGIGDSRPDYDIWIPNENGTMALTNNLAVTPWSASTEYAIDAIVAHNGATYRCTTAHTSGTWWDATKWTADAVAVNSQVPTATSDLTNDGADGTHPFITATAITGKLNSTSAALAFDSTATYAVGAYCTYEGTLYKCTTAVTTAGAWTGSTNWTTDILTDPDATFDLTDGVLRVYDANGNLLWSQLPLLRYDLVTTSTNSPADRSVSYCAINGTSVDVTLPTATSGKACDFILDVYNSSSDTAGGINFPADGTSYKMLTVGGASLSSVTAVAAGQYARFAITQTAFTVNNLTAYQITKVIVGVPS